MLLKHDGCSSIVLSREYLNQNCKLLNCVKSKCIVMHSSQGDVKQTTEIVISAENIIGSHSYRPNWVVTNCRYDAYWGMSWQTSNLPSVDYRAKVVTVSKAKLQGVQKNAKAACIENMGTKNFRSILRKRKNTLLFFKIFKKKSLPASNIAQSKMIKHKYRDVLIFANKFANVFIDHLPACCPPDRSIVHKIEVKSNSSPHFRPIFPLSLLELLATKEYITDLLKTGRFCQAAFPMEPLYFLWSRKPVSFAV